MGNCKIYWDDLSYQLSNDNSNYLIQSTGGSPYKITWDNNEHILNNPNNFSYASYPNTGRYTITANATSNDTRVGCGASITVSTGTLTGKFLRIDTIFVSSGRYKFWEAFSNSGQSSFRYGTRRLWFDVLYPECRNGFFSTDTLGTFNYIIAFNPIDTVTYYLKITDNGINYEYPISDRNSINVVNSGGGNNIIIEGNSFPINDVNSARKDCTEQCPNGTITCDCNDVRCCYQSVYYGYQLVKTIQL